MSGRGAFLGARRGQARRIVAPTPAMGVTASTAANASSYIGAVGHIFTVGAAGLVITHLALRDADGDGVTGQTGIWNNSGTLLASASFSGTGDPLESGYRVKSITTLVLSAGTYRIAGFETGTGFYYRDAPPSGFYTLNTFGGKVSVTNTCYSTSAGFAYPDASDSLAVAVFSIGGFKGY